MIVCSREKLKSLTRKQNTPSNHAQLKTVRIHSIKNVWIRRVITTKQSINFLNSSLIRRCDCKQKRSWKDLICSSSNGQSTFEYCQLEWQRIPKKPPTSTLSWRKSTICLPTYQTSLCSSHDATIVCTKRWKPQYRCHVINLLHHRNQNRTVQGKGAPASLYKNKQAVYLTRSCCILILLYSGKTKYSTNIDFSGLLNF